MRQKILSYIKTWERRCYSDLPDEAPAEISDMVPSYKRIAIAILKNDTALKSLGFTPEVSEYYNILKRIELGIASPIKKKRMTQQELKQTIFEMTDLLIQKTCYIKGYGDKFRICDKDHNPVKNITKQEMSVLQWNNIVTGNGLFWTLIVDKNPFEIALDVRIPEKV